MKKIFILSLLGLFFTSYAQITPIRVGPVSQYGELITGKNSSGKGQIYGTCDSVANGKEVQVRGMSLYWSLLDNALDFWSEEGVTSMVNTMKIQIVRAAMATGTEDWSDGKYKGYTADPNTQKNYVKKVVEAAIKNDIYVIIDWHSHNAHNQTELAKSFFSEMAELYGEYDNVIFELYNEPEKITWSQIKDYANQVIATIRNHSDNLIIVGTPEWDQKTNAAVNNEVTDPENNVAYAFHYYAGSHCFSGQTSWGANCEGQNAVDAMNAGLSVFVSEWGTTDAGGGGDPMGDNTGWQNWMNTHKLSWANWSGSKIPEGSAAFSSGASPTNLQFSTSGNMIKDYLSSNPSSYTTCPEKVSTEVKRPSSEMKITAVSEGIRLSTSKSGLVEIDVFDMLGQSVFSAKEYFNQGSYILPLEKIKAGKYLVRARTGNQTQTITFQKR